MISKWQHGLISDIAIFVLKRDVKLQLTNWQHGPLSKILNMPQANFANFSQFYITMEQL